MTMDKKEGQEDQAQYTYENSAEARRVTSVNKDGNPINTTTITDFNDDLQGVTALNTASVLFARNNGKVVPLIADKTTNSLATMDFGHLEIHEGDHFFVKNWIILTNGQVLDFLAITPDTTKYSHMVVEFNFQAEGNVTIYEDTTTSANGTAVTTINRNRNSGNNAGMLVYSTPTVTGVGNIIARYKAGAGKSVGGTRRANNEIVLKRNTKYLIRITNDTVSDNWIGYLADWYEHIDLN